MQTKKCINSYTVQLFKMFTYVMYIFLCRDRRKSQEISIYRGRGAKRPFGKI